MVAAITACTQECLRRLTKPHLRVWKRRRKISPEDRAVGPQAADNDLRAVLTQGGEDMGEKSSWMRLAVTIAIDWRFVLAIVFLVLALLIK
jgi:hypothetical protein